MIQAVQTVERRLDMHLARAPGLMFVLVVALAIGGQGEGRASPSEVPEERDAVSRSAVPTEASMLHVGALEMELPISSADNLPESGSSLQLHAVENDRANGMENTRGSPIKIDGGAFNEGVKELYLAGEPKMPAQEGEPPWFMVMMTDTKASSYGMYKNEDGNKPLSINKIGGLRSTENFNFLTANIGLRSTVLRI